MKNKYEALIVLDTRGKEDSVEKMISQIGKDIEGEGAKLQQIDQLGRKKFAYAPRHVDEGFYVNFHFEAEPARVEKLRNKLKLNTDIYLQQYQRA